MIQKADFVIVGGGVIGLAVARELLTRKAGSVVVLEKEESLGAHSSGRNSGVVHAGIYYKPGSLKADLCVRGAKRLLEYVRERGLPCAPVGKLIVASDAREAGELLRLHAQALQNGVRVELLDAKRAGELEPEARFFEKSLFSPDTAVIDPKAVLRELRRDIESFGGRIRLGSEAMGVDDAAGEVRTRAEVWSYGHLVNAAGLHADRVAHACGAGLEYTILPVKGAYRRLAPEAARKFRRLIYPVPDKNMPFLGMHVTKMISGEATVGPTAFPVWGRENYGGFSGVKGLEWLPIAADFATMTLTNANNIRALIGQEAARWTRTGFMRELGKVAPKLRAKDVGPWFKAGIRAQLIHRRTKKFEMDFVVRRGRRSTHILNAVSPAFTGSLCFAEHVVRNFVVGGR